MQTRQPGFTLLELLVVTLIMGILMGALTLAFDTNSATRDLQSYSDRLAKRFEIARDRALQDNVEWGVFVDDEGYRVSAYDPEQQRWLDQLQTPFKENGLSVELRYSLTTEGYAQAPQDDAFPDLIFFSSGEVTPFTLEIVSDAAPETSWALSSDGISKITVNRKARL